MYEVRALSALELVRTNEVTNLRHNGNFVQFVHFVDFVAHATATEMDAGG